MGDPYVKLLSTTNITTATLEFQKDRGGNSTLKVTNPTNSGSGTTSTQSPGSSPTAKLTLADLQSKIDHLQKLEPIFFAVLGVNLVVMLAAVGLGIWFFCCRRRKSDGGSGGGGRKPSSRFPRRGRAGGGDNTISTMELTTKDDTGASYAAVSTLNPDGESFIPPVLYDSNGQVGSRQSTVSFRTDPYRHSRTLSGVSAFRPMVPTAAGTAITTGPEPMTPGSESGFDFNVPSPTTPERARVSSVPSLGPGESFRRQSAMPPPGAIMAPGLMERYRTSSFGVPKDAPILESEPTTPTRPSNASASTTTRRQPSPLSSPVGEKTFNLDVPPASPSSSSLLHPSGSPPSPGGGGNDNMLAAQQQSFVRDPPSQRHSAMPGMPFPSPSTPPPAESSSPYRHSAVPAGARGAPNTSGFAPLTRQVSPLAGPAQAYGDPETDNVHGDLPYHRAEAPVADLSIPQINVSSDQSTAPASEPGSMPQFASGGTDYRHSALPPPRAPSLNNNDPHRRSAAM